MTHEQKGDDSLRTKAERLLRSKPAANRSNVEDLQRALYELQLHETELQMQNEELRRTQVELEASRGRFSDLYDFAPVGYVTIAAKGLIVSANLTACDLFGRPRQEVLRSPLSAYMSKASSDDLYKHFKTTRQSTSRQSCELTLNEECCSQEVRFDSIHQPPSVDQPATMRIVITNITAQKKAERERLRLENQLRETERLKTLGLITAGVAHDFNNLLSPILAHTELAMMDTAADSPVQENLKEVKVATGLAAELCQEMQAYLGAETLKPKPIDVREVVNKTTPLLRTRLPKSVQLSVAHPDDLPDVNGDHSQIHRVVMNLAINAIESMRESGGHITISTDAVALSREELAEMDLISDATPGQFVCIEVSDDGYGMDHETKARMLDPFFSTKFPGRGLGMAAVVCVARSHRAAIAIKSDLDHGTTFRVCFPAASTQPFYQRDVSPNAVVTGQGTILLVDDDPMVRDASQKVLEAAGYTVTVASCGRDAIEQFRDRSDAIDAVLLDYSMPDIDGMETLKQLREIQSHVAVLMQSGFAEPSGLRRIDEQPVTGFIQKPYLASELTNKLRKIIADHSRGEE